MFDVQQRKPLTELTHLAGFLFWVHNLLLHVILTSKEKRFGGHRRRIGLGGMLHDSL